MREVAGIPLPTCALKVERANLSLALHIGLAKKMRRRSPATGFFYNADLHCCNLLMFCSKFLAARAFVLCLPSSGSDKGERVS